MKMYVVMVEHEFGGIIQNEELICVCDNLIKAQEVAQTELDQYIVSDERFEVMQRLYAMSVLGECSFYEEIKRHELECAYFALGNTVRSAVYEYAVNTTDRPLIVSTFEHKNRNSQW